MGGIGSENHKGMNVKGSRRQLLSCTGRESIVRTGPLKGKNKRNRGK